MTPAFRAVVRALRHSRADPFTHAAAGAREAATSPWNKHKPPTEAQAQAGNYRKGRFSWQGFNVAVENDVHTVREGTSPDGTRWSNRMAAAYGEFSGTRGSDGDPVDLFMGPFPESKTVWVLNQRNADGSHDEHKVLAGFVDERHAVEAYRTSYSPGWDRFDPAPIRMTVDQLRQWLKSGDMMRPITADQVPQETAMSETATVAPMTRVFWDSAAEPRSGLNLADVLYRIRKHDGTDGLVMDAMTMADLTEGASVVLDAADAPQVAIFDSMVVQAGRLAPKMEALQRIMAAAAAGIEPVSMQISEPLKRFGGLHLAVLFELSDGQTITIWLHNPDSTPTRISPADDLVSWKWMLNKKDVTIAVAPESGKDLNVREVARRLMKLAAKNSAAFARANAKRAETMQIIGDLKAAVAEKQGVLSGLMSDIEAAKAAGAAIAAAGLPAGWGVSKNNATGEFVVTLRGAQFSNVGEPDSFAAMEQAIAAAQAWAAKLAQSQAQAALPAWRRKGFDPKTPEGWWSIRSDEAALLYWQDDLDAMFQERIVAVRNALRALGWAGDAGQPLTFNGATLGMQLVQVGGGKNIVGVTYTVTGNLKGTATFGADGLLDNLEATPEQIAADLHADVALDAPGAEDDGPVKWPSLRSGDMVKATRLNGETTIGRVQLIEQEKDSPYAVQSPGWKAIVQPSNGGKPETFYTYSGDEIELLESVVSAPALKVSDLWRKISANEYRITALDGSEWTVARVGSKWLTEAGQSFPVDQLDAAKLAVEDSIAARARTAADEAASRETATGPMQQWRVTNTSGYNAVHTADTMVRAIQAGMAEVDYTLASFNWKAEPVGDAPAAPAAPDAYAFPDASDEAKGLFAIGASKGGQGAYSTAVAIDKAARNMGMTVRWEATNSLPVFDSTVLDKVGEATLEPSGATPTSSKTAVNVFKSGDKVVCQDDGKDYTVTGQRGAMVSVKGGPKALNANRLKLASGAKPDTMVMDDATGGLFGDGDAGYIVGTLSRNTVAVATVHLREDGQVAFKVAPNLAAITGYSDGEVAQIQADLETGWRDDWYTAMGELATATEDVQPAEVTAAAQAAQFAAEDKLKAEQDAAMAASEAARTAAIADAEAVGKGKAGFMGVVATGGDAIKAALARKNVGSFVLAVAPMGGDKWGVAMFSRQMLAKGGRKIDPAGKVGNAQVSRLYSTAAAAYEAGVESLKRGGGVVLGFGPASAAPMTLTEFENANGEAWQVTRAEWLRMMRDNAVSLGQQPERDDVYGDFHRSQVKAALDTGKPVKPDVLADYPGMAAETDAEKAARYAKTEQALANLVSAAAGEVPTAVPPSVTNEIIAEDEAAKAAQRSMDLATLGTIASGTHPDMLEPELADEIERVLAAYPGDAEVEAAAERAITAYSNGLMAATA